SVLNTIFKGFLRGRRGLIRNRSTEFARQLKSGAGSAHFEGQARKNSKPQRSRRSTKALILSFYFVCLRDLGGSMFHGWPLLLLRKRSMACKSQTLAAWLNRSTKR